MNFQNMRKFQNYNIDNIKILYFDSKNPNHFSFDINALNKNKFVYMLRPDDIKDS